MAMSECRIWFSL